MVRNKFKCRFLFLLSVLILNVCTKSLPVEKILSVLDSSVTSIPKQKILKWDGPEVITDSEISTFRSNVAENARPSNEGVRTEVANTLSIDSTRSLARNIRPGQRVQSYLVKISFEGDTFNGEAVISLSFDIMDDPIKFHYEALDIQDVRISSTTADAAQGVHFNPEDGILEIDLEGVSRNRVVVIEYTGEISNFGNGIFQGSFND